MSWWWLWERWCWWWWSSDYDDDCENYGVDYAGDDDDYDRDDDCDNDDVVVDDDVIAIIFTALDFTLYTLLYHRSGVLMANNIHDYR